MLTLAVLRTPALLSAAIHILLRLFAQPALFRLALQQLRARVEYFTYVGQLCACTVTCCARAVELIRTPACHACAKYPPSIPLSRVRVRCIRRLRRKVSRSCKAQSPCTNAAARGVLKHGMTATCMQHREASKQYLFVRRPRMRGHANAPRGTDDPPRLLVHGRGVYV